MKKVYYYAIAVVVLVGLFFVFTTEPPSYDDPNTARALYGPSDAKVKIEEYSDFQCPACGAAHPIIKKVLQQYEGEVSFQMFHFPLRQIHPYAQKAAEASECANDQGKFFEYMDVLYTNQRNLKTSDLKNYASVLDLDREKFDACLDSNAKQVRVDNDYNSARQKQISSTPTIFVNGKRASSYSEVILIQMIEEELAKAE